MVIGLPRSGHRQPWDASADAELTRRIADGQLLREISMALGRTQEAVRSRANVLKLPVRSSNGRQRVGIIAESVLAE